MKLKTKILIITVFVFSVLVLQFMTDSNKGKHIDQEISRIERIANTEKNSSNDNTKTEVVISSKRKSAFSYIGYYLLHTVAVPIYCEDKGYDLTEFIYAMEAANVSLLRRAKNILKYDQVLVNEYYSTNRIALMKSAELIIKQAADHNKGTVDDACAFYLVASDFLVNHYQFSEFSPEEYSVLTETD